MEATITVGLVLSGIIFVAGMIGGYIPLYRAGQSTDFQG
jgi:hypothetical protein